MWDFDTEVSEIIPRTPTIRSFRFLAGAADVSFIAGQYEYVVIRVGEGTEEHHFSISSSPTERGYLEHTKRITQSAFSQALAQIKPGDWAHLRGPEGQFTLPESPRKLGFLSGGIGITGMRSMLRYIADRDLPFDVKLLFGNSTYEEICFREELDAMSQKLPNIEVTHVLSSPPPGWTGPMGRINSDLVQQYIPDYRERLFYMAGPPGMVESLFNQLRALGLPESQIKRDVFTGYGVYGQ